MTIRDFLLTPNFTLYLNVTATVLSSWTLTFFSFTWIQLNIVSMFNSYLIYFFPQKRNSLRLIISHYSSVQTPLGLQMPMKIPSLCYLCCLPIYLCVSLYFSHSLESLVKRTDCSPSLYLLAFLCPLCLHHGRFDARWVTELRKIKWKRVTGTTPNIAP